MAKKAHLFLICFACVWFINCSPSSESAKRIIENGVEVIVNKMTPNTIHGKPCKLILHKEFTLDTESHDIIEAGLGDAGEIAVDYNGNIYIVGFKNRENFIYKFDRQGHIISSFGKMGQGPGELQWPLFPQITKDNEFVISDAQARKIVFYNLDGTFMKEIPFGKTGMMIAQPLDNGNYLMYGVISFNSSVDYLISGLALYDSILKKIRNIEIYKYPQQMNQLRLHPFFMWRIANGLIYTINEERGYEICAYNLDGRLVRKIRKDYKRVSPTEEIKKSILGPGYDETGSMNKGYFPTYMPPLNRFFIDDEGRIFAMTYERGNHSNEYFYDIFDPRSFFIDRVGLPETWLGAVSIGPQYAVIKNHYLYWRHSKEDSGYVEIIVYRMKWDCS
jgi:hypothetical protein